MNNVLEKKSAKNSMPFPRAPTWSPYIHIHTYLAVHPLTTEKNPKHIPSYIAQLFLENRVEITYFFFGFHKDKVRVKKKKVQFATREVKRLSELAEYKTKNKTERVLSLTVTERSTWLKFFEFISLPTRPQLKTLF